MKRFAVLILTILLLSGCSASGSIKEPVTFYYKQAEYDFYAPDSVIGSELREALGHRRDLRYLISLYLMGPIDTTLVNPFPRYTQLVSVTREQNTILIEISDTSYTLSDANLSLACACLTKTCLELTNAESVTVISGNRTLNTALNDLFTFDESTYGEITEQGGT